MTELILIGTNLAAVGGLYWLLLKMSKRVAAEVQVAREELRSHVVNEATAVKTEVSAALKNEVGAVKTEVKTLQSRVDGYVNEHKRELAKTFTKLGEHAKAVIDSTTVRQAVAVTQRVICPLCNRVVVKFEQEADGSIKGCLDCLAREGQ